MIENKREGERLIENDLRGKKRTKQKEGTMRERETIREKDIER